MRGLLTALATRAMDRFAASLTEVAAQAGDSPLEQLRAIGTTYIRFAVQHPAYFFIITRLFSTPVSVSMSKPTFSK